MLVVKKNLKLIKLLKLYIVFLEVDCELNSVKLWNKKIKILIY